MAAKQEPNLGLNYGWPLGDSGWNLEMDENLRAVGALVQLSVISATTATPPASPTQGDRYIVPAAATGDWAGHTNKVVRYIGTDWEVYTPDVGWHAYVKDQSVAFTYTATGWGPHSYVAASNANGTYMVFADGTLICYANKTINFAVNNADGSGFQTGSFTSLFPYQFTTPPYVSGTAKSATATVMLTANGNSLDNWDMTALAVSALPAADYDCRLFAIGRWK